jgi:hypothetical protein
VLFSSTPPATRPHKKPALAGFFLCKHDTRALLPINRNGGKAEGCRTSCRVAIASRGRVSEHGGVNALDTLSNR